MLKFHDISTLLLFLQNDKGSFTYYVDCRLGGGGGGGGGCLGEVGKSGGMFGGSWEVG